MIKKVIAVVLLIVFSFLILIWKENSHSFAFMLSKHLKAELHGIKCLTCFKDYQIDYTLTIQNVLSNHSNTFEFSCGGPVHFKHQGDLIVVECEREELVQVIDLHTNSIRNTLKNPLHHLPVQVSVNGDFELITGAKTY